MDTEAGSTPTSTYEAGHQQDERKEAVMSTQEKNPGSEVGTPNDSAKNEGDGKEVKRTRYALAREQQLLKRYGAKAGDSSDPEVVRVLASTNAAMVDARMSVAALISAYADRDATRVALSASRADLGVKLVPLMGQLRTTERGREFAKSCTSAQPEVTFHSLDAGIAKTGLDVTASLLSDAREKAVVVDRAVEARALAEQQVISGQANFRAAKSRLKLALSELFHTIEGATMRERQQAEVIPIAPAAPPVAVPVAHPGAGQAA